MELRGTSELSDEELWKDAAGDGSAAFGALFDRHARTIYNFCFRRTGNWTVAEDLMSAVFLEAWGKRDKIVLLHGSLLPWLLGVANNLMRNQRRSERRKGQALQRVRSQLTDEPDHGDLVGQRLDDERRMRQVLSRLEKLNEREREVIALCIWMELSYEEAALAMQVPVGTVRSRLSRARARLREPSMLLGHERDDDPALARATEAAPRRAEA